MQVRPKFLYFMESKFGKKVAPWRWPPEDSSLSPHRDTSLQGPCNVCYGYEMAIFCQNLVFQGNLRLKSIIKLGLELLTQKRLQAE